MMMNKHDTSKYAKTLAEIKATGTAQINHTALVIAKQKDITNETANGYAAGLIALRSFYDNKLRERARSGQVPSISQSAPGPHESTANSGLATQVTTALIPSAAKRTDPLSAANGDALPELCAETTLQLISLQSWINKQAGNK